MDEDETSDTEMEFVQKTFIEGTGDISGHRATVKQNNTEVKLREDTLIRRVDTYVSASPTRSKNVVWFYFIFFHEIRFWSSFL